MTEYHNPPTVKYFKDFRRVEPIDINSSRLSDFKTCPTLYFFKDVLGYKPRYTPVYLTWGGTIHKFRETLEVLYDKGEYPLPAIVGLAVIEAMKYWGDTPDPPATDRKFGFMTKARLSDVMMHIGKLWIQEKDQGDIKVVSAEKSFIIQLPDGSWSSGTPDQWVRWKGKLWGRDFKHTTKDLKYFKRTVFPNDQFVRYTYAEQKLHGERISGQIIDIIHTTRDVGPISHRELIAFTPEVLDKWEEEQKFWVNALSYARDNDNYPQSEKTCSFCPFHEVCQSQTQAGKEYVLRTKYKFEPWDNIREGTLLLGG